LTKTWEEKKRNKSGSVKSTKEIYETLKNNKGKINHYLPMKEAVQYNERELSIPPYLMGCILGDGSISGSVSVTNVDEELINRVSEESKKINCHSIKSGSSINYNIRSNLFNNKPAQEVKTTNIITGEEKKYPSIGIALLDLNIKRGALHHRCLNKSIIDNVKYEFLPRKVRWQNPIKNHLHNLGLFGKKSWEKFIPDVYKYNSIENRIDLIRGLMDTDGTIKKNGEASFTTTSLVLANDIIEIVRSLGGRANLRSRNRIALIFKCRVDNLAILIK
jgi:intein/homing endonuclease